MTTPGNTSSRKRLFRSLKKLEYEIAYHGHARAILEGDFWQAAQELESILSAFTFEAAALMQSGGGESKQTQQLRRSLEAAGWLKRTLTVESWITESLSKGKKKMLDPENALPDHKSGFSTHIVDHLKVLPVRGEVGHRDHRAIALEIEWNAKDTHFDRDLQNFRRLHSDGAISLGIIITRGASLQASLLDIVLQFCADNDIQCVEDLDRFGIVRTKRQRDAIEAAIKKEHSFREAFGRGFVKDKYASSTTHWSKLQDKVERGAAGSCPLVLIGVPKAVVR